MRRALWLALLVGLSTLTLSNVRGGFSMDEVATRYVAAVRNGDVTAAAQLMPPDRTEMSEIRERIERYRAVAGRTVQIAYLQHPEAAYIRGARISLDGARFDEVAIQTIGGRWYLVHFPTPTESLP